MLILSALAVAPRHGYGISQALESAGLQPIKGAQLYPLLVRLQDEGKIVAQWEQSESGPARKVYELTAAGHRQREELCTEWQTFMTAVETVSRVG
ncbi:PadR family transcriptional regulator [Nocardioides aequoreus]|uniref:PadR family transcriptional regulator n=1 Tax=Nocardioides aequoreus TaxID=397278 RepID=UPI000A02E6B4|nr:helix-turn-helix transcriptional regulator [Nocardioides aequoreus]